MSYTRIVKGTYTKIVHGNYNMYANGNINFTAGKEINIKSDVGINYGSEMKDPPVIEMDEQPKSIFKNILIILQQPNTKNRTKITDFSELFANGWYGFEARNIQESYLMLSKYLTKNKADNIVIESHGQATTFANITVNSGLFIDNFNNSKVMGDDLKKYINNKSELSIDLIKNIESLLNIIKMIKKQGNLVFRSCYTAEQDDFLNSLMELTNKEINMYGFIDWINFDTYRVKRNNKIIVGAGWGRLENCGPANFEENICENKAEAVKYYHTSGEKKVYKSLIISKKGVITK